MHVSHQFGKKNERTINTCKKLKRKVFTSLQICHVMEFLRRMPNKHYWPLSLSRNIENENGKFDKYRSSRYMIYTFEHRLIHSNARIYFSEQVLPCFILELYVLNLNKTLLHSNRQVDQLLYPFELKFYIVDPNESRIV